MEAYTFVNVNDNMPQSSSYIDMDKFIKKLSDNTKYSSKLGIIKNTEMGFADEGTRNILDKENVINILLKSNALINVDNLRNLISKCINELQFLIPKVFLNIYQKMEYNVDGNYEITLYGKDSDDNELNSKLKGNDIIIYWLSLCMFCEGFQPFEVEIEQNDWEMQDPMTLIYFKWNDIVDKFRKGKEEYDNYRNKVIQQKITEPNESMKKKAIDDAIAEQKAIQQINEKKKPGEVKEKVIQITETIKQEIINKLPLIKISDIKIANWIDVRRKYMRMLIKNNDSFLKSVKRKNRKENAKQKQVEQNVQDKLPDKLPDTDSESSTKSKRKRPGKKERQKAREKSQKEQNQSNVSNIF